MSLTDGVVASMRRMSLAGRGAACVWLAAGLIPSWADSDERAAAVAPEQQAPPSRAQELDALAQEVGAVERAFANTMAERDLDAFADMVAEDAVFRGGSGLLVGKAAVVAAWKKLFKPGPAPFSWEPDTVTVADSGQTALSSGPVFDPTGKQIARYMSVWRRESLRDGKAKWRIVVDQGVSASECK
jgi:ketosteroid isomerase-like protein